MMETMKENCRMVNDMDRGNASGEMELIMKVNGEMGKSMDMEN